MVAYEVAGDIRGFLRYESVNKQDDGGNDEYICFPHHDSPFPFGFGNKWFPNSTKKCLHNEISIPSIKGGVKLTLRFILPFNHQDGPPAPVRFASLP